jgi:hypothetical protein
MARHGCKARATEANARAARAPPAFIPSIGPQVTIRLAIPEYPIRSLRVVARKRK